MKNVKIYLILLIGLTVAILSCNKKENVEPVNTGNPKTPETPVKKVKTPGKFGLTQMQTSQRIRKQIIDGITYVPYEKSAANQRTTNTVNFDIGKLKASKSFYFILSNIGDTSLTNITIEANNPNVEVFPKSIDRLEPAGKTGIVPLLELGIVHGNRLNGVGFQSLLPMGDNTIELTIKGQTQGEKGEETVELKADIKLFAGVMDIELFQAGTAIDLKKIDYSTTLGAKESGLGFIIGYKVNSNTIAIQNSGNVVLDVKVVFNATSGKKIINHTLNVGEKKDIKMFSYAFIVVDSGGFIADLARLQIGNGGRAYFAVNNR